jgi:hypothetical protein
LTTGLVGSIRREDILTIAGPIGSPYIDVPTNLKPGDTWFFDETVKFKYSVRGLSNFRHALGFDIWFDMKFIDPTQVMNVAITSFDAGWVNTTVLEREGAMAFSGSFKVVEPYGDLVASAVAQVPHPNLARAVQENNVQLIQRTVRISVPEPTVKQGRPLRGHYTVDLGRHKVTEANRMRRTLGSKSIISFAVPVRRSTDQIVTLGSFAVKKDAELLATVVREAFKIDGTVTNNIEMEAR